MWEKQKHVEGFYNVSTKIIDIQARLGNVTIMPRCKVYSWLDMRQRNRVYERMFTATPLWMNEWMKEWMNACMYVCMYAYAYVYF